MGLVSPLQRLSDSPKIFCTQSLGLERGWLRSSLRGDRLCPPVMSWRYSENLSEMWSLTCSGAALTLESFLSAFPSCKCKWIPSISKDSPFTCKCPSQGSHCRILLSVWPSVLAWDTFHHNSSLPLCCLSTQLTFMILDCFFFCLLGPLPMSRNATWLPSPESKNGQSNKFAKIDEKRSELFWVLFWRKIWIPGSCMYWW